MICLGIDTSNYTTSAALYDSLSGELISERRLLSVKEGEVGLRQSEAVFQHTLALPAIISEVFSKTDKKPDVVSVSVSPRDEDGSYMPCFMCGKGVAVSIARASGIPVRFFSHQAGHIAAAVFSAKKPELLLQKFIAFHVSGGTTEAVLVSPDKEKIISVDIIGGSSDLKAGQAIDRVGRMLGLPFPAGAEIDKLSRLSKKKYTPKPCFKNGSCSLSGLENKCGEMLKNGESREDTANFCISYICAAIDKMTEYLGDRYPGLPFVYSGGVMSNSVIREYISGKYGAVFAADGFSSDNAAGVAYLGTVNL